MNPTFTGGYAVDTLTLLKHMYEKGASDLLLTAGAPPQLRISGSLHPTEFDILKAEDTKDLAYSLMTKEQIKEFENNKELDSSFGIESISRFRINTYRQRGAVGVSIRLIPHEIPSMEELGLPEAAKMFVEQPNGLIVVTGPTDSGKSTTLASMIDYINSYRKCHIVCIEDPIEYLHRHNQSIIDQRELGRDTSSFPLALKHVFRQTPDVIMIGEMRDLETIKSALNLAETGHLILATLHTGDATQAITRIIDVFPAEQQPQIRIQLSLTLIGVMAQELLPEAEGDGRVLASEVMVANSAIRNLIRKNELHQIYSVIQMGKKDKMVTMNQSLHDLYSEQKITLQDAVDRTKNKKEFMQILEAHNNNA